MRHLAPDTRSPHPRKQLRRSLASLALTIVGSHTEMMTTVRVSFEPDSEGFTSRACGNCSASFKVAFGQGASAPLAYCPHCGQRGDRWETPEQSDYGKAFVARALLSPALDKLNQSFRKLGRSRGPIQGKVTGRTPTLNVPTKPVERADELPARTILPCCGETIRHSASATPRYCAICGAAVSG